MWARFDENARAVFARAGDEARALGREYVDTEHVLLGVCHHDATDSDPVLAPAGITTESVRAWLAQHGDRGDGTTDRPLPITPNVRFVLNQTRVEADGRQHQSIGPAHVLLALIRCATVTPEASVAALLRDCGIDLVALHVRAAARANTGSAGHGFPFLGEDLAARPCPPGRARRWLWHAAVLAGYTPLAALAIVLAPAGARAAALAFAVIEPPVLYLMGRLLAWPLWRRRLAREDVEPVQAAGLRAALAPAGLREVQVLCVSSGRLAARSAGAARRFGRVGVIFLRPFLKKGHPDLTRFITAHEAAHLARDDSMSDGLALACLVTLAGVSIGTRPADTWWLFISAFALFVTLRWGQELACDRIAVNAVGPLSARAYIAYLDALDARRRSRPFLRRIRAQLRGWLTHPPRRMRCSALARTSASAVRNSAADVRVRDRGELADQGRG